MKKYANRIVSGIWKENPVLVLMLGMCATLAVTTSAINGLGMGLSTAAVLILSNLMISLLRKVIPGGVRMPAYIVIIATFVTIVQLLLQAYVPTLNDSLGIFIPLIVVNCIILGRAEAFASQNGPLLSVCDGIGMGLGFTLALTLIGLVRELLGAGTAFGVTVMPSFYVPVAIMTMAPGAFFVLALLTALQNKFHAPSATNKDQHSELVCGGNCAACAGCKGAANHLQIAEETERQARLLAEQKKAAAQAKKVAAEQAEKQEGGEQV